MAKPVHYHEGNFPPVKIDWEQLIPLLGSANAAVARYDGALAAVVNPAIFAFSQLLNIAEGREVF